ncbi:hypothetical protein EZJ49_11725 [Bdellovibrio bacteriovorus]|uniref:hypothetical protein n=1 Tax=Bdellovibrio bacteriovorus TaxID=959 RepID=UPI0021D2C901|nr:hypothetical protein [Bdellovibrio bacteriovorus]UXR63740.1 hypothetical protein EZJ49_11725 [Bdellovibrio bacteriovorus]
MVAKLLGTLIILAALTIGYTILKDDLDLPKKSGKKSSETCVQLTPAQQLAKMINDDFQTLEAEGQLPAEWKDIATVEIRMNSTLARTLLGKERPNIQRVKQGANYLELEIVDLPDDENPGVIIQASLFNIKSRNKIFEIGRTYTMNDLNRVTTEKTPEAPVKKDGTTSGTTTPTPAAKETTAPPAVNTPPPADK